MENLIRQWAKLEFISMRVYIEKWYLSALKAGKISTAEVDKNTKKLYEIRSYKEMDAWYRLLGGPDIKNIYMEE